MITKGTVILVIFNGIKRILKSWKLVSGHKKNETDYNINYNKLCAPNSFVPSS